MEYYLVSDSHVPHKSRLPTWFVNMYKNYINFDHIFWVSKSAWGINEQYFDFRKYLQKVVIEMKNSSTIFNSIILTYIQDDLDIETINARSFIHYYIDANEIKELDIK